MGLYAIVDDAIFAGVGGLVGITTLAIHDLIVGEPSSAGSYAGAFIGGAIAGEALLYSPILVPTLGATGAVLGTGAISSFVGGVTKQGVDISSGTQVGGFSSQQLAIDTLLGTATSFIPGVKLPGIGLGRNSFSAISKSNVTKLSNGTIDNISGLSVAKLFTSSFFDSSAGNLSNDFLGDGFNYFSNNSANGGYVLYPSKINTNISQEVYVK